MLMNESGHLQVTVVDGTTLTGIFAADGSLNVYDATNETGFVGLQHPCGAINCVSSSGTTLTGAQAPNGAYYVVNDSAEIGLRHSSGGLCVTGFTTSGAVSFLSTWGPYGMVMDFTDASIAIKEASGVLDFTSQGQISNGLLVGPGAKTTYSAPSAKLTEQEDGNLGFQAHNLYLNSAAPANQSITVLSGASYAITITGSVSMVASGAATGTWTAGTTTFTAATGTLTLGSTSGSGTVHLRRTPSVDNYIATTSAAAYDLPYVWSGGVRQGIQVEPAATNLNVNSDLTSAAWTKRGTVSVTKNQTGPDGVANSACRVTGLGAGGANDIYETGYAVVRFTASQAVTQSFYIRKVSASGVLRVTNATTGTLYYSIDFSLLGSGWERITPTHQAVTIGTLTATAGGIFGPQFVVTSGTLDFDIYVPQLETGTVATSPILTYGATVARAADSPEIPTSLFPYNVSEGTLYIKAVLASGANAGRLLSLNDNSATLRVADIFVTSATAQAYYKTSDASQISYTSLATPGAQRVALRYKLNDYNVSYNGTLGGADISTGAIQTATMLEIGHLANANQLPMIVQQVVYFPDGKANAVLQALGA